MSISYSFGQFSQIAEVIKGEAALKLVGFFGNRKSIHIPARATPGHLIEKVIGQPAFAALVKEFGGETLPIPAVNLEPLQLAGRVHLLRDSGLSARRMAALLGFSHAHIASILATLKREGFDDLAAVLEEESTGELENV